MSEDADAIAVPADQMFQPDGQILDVVRDSAKPLYAICSNETGSQQIVRLRQVPSIAGLVFSELDESN